MKRLSGKCAVVTGASRGIGLALARALAAEGCQLALCSRSVESVQTAFPDLRDTDLASACDVRDEDSVRIFFEAVRDRFGRLDILINNAGHAHPMVNVEALALSLWRDTLDTNLTGTFLCTRAALPLMAPGAAVVNNLSVAAVQAFARESAWSSRNMLPQATGKSSSLHM